MRDDFRFSSGRLCLDFAGTLGARHLAPVERLGEPADLGRWLRLAMALHEDVQPTGSELCGAIGLREAIYRLVHPASRDRPDPADIAIVNRWAAERVFVPQLVPGARTVVLHAARPVQAGLAAVARDAVDLLSGPWIERVRECGHPDCSLLFADFSRPGVRRWCDMQSCGNRAKVGRYRAAHAAAAAPAGATMVH